MRRGTLRAGTRFISTVSSRGPTPLRPRRVDAALKRSAERLRRGRKLRPPTPTHADAMSALETLRGELASLRQAGLPSWLESLSDPTPARYVAFTSRGATRDGDEDEDGDVDGDRDGDVDGDGDEDGDEDPTAGVVANPNQATGPWHVHAWLRGADGAGYHLSPTHFRLSFSAAYPREPPDVHVLSVCHHALLDDDKEVSALFYDAANLPAAKDPETNAQTPNATILSYDARGVLAACHRFLSQPLDLPDDAGERGSEATRRNCDRERLRLAWESAARANEARDATVASFLSRASGDPAGPLDARWFDENGWPRDFFAPEFLNVLDDIGRSRETSESASSPASSLARDSDAADAPKTIMSAEARRSVLQICREEAPGVFSFPMLAESACDSLIREIEHFQSPAVNLPVRRPNSMNNYGVVVNEMGMERAIDALQRDVLAVIAEALFPKQGGGALTSHHAFVVQYQEGKDLGLDMHTDDSDVTFNVCLGKAFDGAGLTFCGVLGAAETAAPHRRKTAVYRHVQGRCVAHLGAHRHGADDLRAGERVNLIVWNHSIAYRSSDAYRWRDVPEETEPPSLECLSYTHDRDYRAHLPYPEGKEGFAKTAWYPPRGDRVKMR